MQRSLRLINFFFPDTIDTIRIVDCISVTINNQKLRDLQLKELTIKSVEEVLVGPKMFKRVDKLLVENVGDLELEESALDNLESNSVHFVNTNFSSPFNAIEMKPNKIQSELSFSRSTLPKNFAIALKEDQQPSLLIRDCQIEGIKMGVFINNLQMVNNRFLSLPAKQSLSIHYTKYVSLTGNILMGSPNRTLPDVNSKRLIGGIRKNETRLDGIDANSFFEAFLFDFKGILSEAGTVDGKRVPINNGYPLLFVASQLITITIISIILQ